MNSETGHKYAILVSVFFLFLYSLIVFPNHYNFRTFALDLGAYSNAMYDYAHFRFSDSGVFKSEAENMLADHLDFYLLIFSPLSLVFKTYTLLLLQLAAIISGGIGIYKYLNDKYANPGLSLAAMLHFYLFFGIFSALSFDYHSNVVAALQVPWLFYFLNRKKYLSFTLMMIFMMLAKETIPPWCFSICIALIIINRKDKKSVLWLKGNAVFALTYFWVGINYIMPYFSNAGSYEHFKYDILGTDYSSSFRFMLEHPFKTFSYLFVNHSGNPLYDFVKTETYVFLLLSGLYLLFLRPVFLLMLVWPICSKMLYNEPGAWSIDSHYSIEFAPVICLAAFSFICELKRPGLRKILVYAVCVGSLSVTIHYMDNSIYLHDYNRVRIYSAKHYNRHYNVSEVHLAFKTIPENAAVSVQSPLLPHLAFRDKCYQFPIVKDAEYIVISESETETYPISKTDLLKQVNDSFRTGRWNYLLYDSNIRILKRND